MKMRFLKFMGIIMCIALVMGDKKLHDYMTDEEILQVFNSHRYAIPEYELGSINHEKHQSDLRSKRLVDDKKVSFKAFGKNIELFLELNDHVLYGNATPVYVASFDGEKIRYERRPYPLPKSMRSYVDERNDAALTMHEDDSGRHHLNGVVGNNLQIRSLPSSVHGLIEKNYLLQEPTKNYHAFIQMNISIENTAMNYSDQMSNKSHRDCRDNPACEFAKYQKNYIRRLLEHSKKHDKLVANTAAEFKEILEDVLQRCKKHPVDVERDSLEKMQTLISEIESFFAQNSEPEVTTEKPKTSTIPSTVTSEPTVKTSDLCKYMQEEQEHIKQLFEAASKSKNLEIKSICDTYDHVIVYTAQICKLNPAHSMNEDTKQLSEIQALIKKLESLLPGVSSDEDPAIDNEALPNTTQKPIDESTAYLQLLITMDYKTVKSFKSIEDIAIYQAAFWNSVDLRFRQFTNPRIRLNIAGLIVPQDEGAAFYLNYSKGKEIISKMAKVFANDEVNFPSNSYDIVIGFLHTKTLPGLLGAYGFAFVQGACLKESNSLILADKGGYEAVLPAAHEIGHSMGAVHDDDITCRLHEPGYIMYPANPRSKDGSSIRWSECSYQKINQFLRSDRGKCLYNRPDVGFENPKLFPGELMTRDEQCEKIFGPGWAAEKRNNSSTKDDCIHLKCFVEKQNELNMTYISSDTLYSLPPDGTECGNNMACLNGECVDASSFLRR